MVEVVDNTSKENINSDISMNESLVESKDEKFVASTNSGETELGSVEVEVIKETIDKIPGPGKVIGYGFKSIGASVKQVFKHPLRLLPAIILAVIWLVINILQACNVNSTPVRVISFLTFAEGGMHGGFIGAVGGIIGKGMFVGAVIIIIGLFKKKNKCEKRSLKDVILGSFGFSLDTLFAFLTGIGLSMLFYLFISGGALKVSFMGGMGAMILAAFTALNGGFLVGLINAFTSRGKTKASPTGRSIARGLALGFIISAFLGLIGIKLILIITGLVLIVGGIVMMILQKTGVVKLGKEDNKQWKD